MGNAVIVICACVVALASIFLLMERMLFLARTRFGATVYFANAVQDMLIKRLGLSRPIIDSVAVVIAMLGCLGLGGAAPYVAVVVFVAVVSMELYVHRFEREMLTSAYSIVEWESHVHPSKARPTEHPEGIPSPSAEGLLTCSLLGPFVKRYPRYDLGDLMLGRRLSINVTVANHSQVTMQTPTRVTIRCGPGVTLESDSTVKIPLLRSGDFQTFDVRLVATSAASSGQISLLIKSIWQSHSIVVSYRSVAGASADLLTAEPHGYPGACRSAFAWRGDMDLYDLATFQSIEGLESTLSMAARYRMPQTMYVSTRLTFDAEQATDYFDHYGVSRGQEEIPKFIRWFSENVELGHDIRYPFAFERPYAMELGNHGHLHYGTDAAASADNNWRFCARMGDGDYPWTKEAKTSLEEQRDNAIETRRLCEALFGYTPRSWAMPDRTNDAFTPRAMEQAGCEVLSDSDVRTAHNVIYQPRPHHPPGTAAVELTKRYPGDPQNAYHVAMNLFWLHRAHRLGIPVIFMGHQHLNQFVGPACIRFTEYVLRYVLERFHGDLHVNTVYGIGAYWKDVYSPAHRCVSVRIEGKTVIIDNEGSREHKDFSVQIALRDGRKAVYLLGLAPGTRSTISLDGSVDVTPQ